jgi:poly-gamma-glutamate capsule biosynthesis protein CapA/YwtB (metallophosphatase superfamily)
MMSARLIAIILGSCLALFAPGGRAAEEVTIVAGGDIQWATKRRTIGVYLHPDRGFREELLSKIIDRLPLVSENRYRQVPYLYEQHEDLWPKLGKQIELEPRHSRTTIYHDMRFETVEDAVEHPFSKIAPVLREADIAFANLENPLSERGRLTGAFRGSPALAGAMASAGIDVVSTANNHALDIDEAGLVDTLESLAAAGIAAVGTGPDLERATAPVFLERNGIRFAFLAYSMLENSGELGFAWFDRSGVAPLDPFLVEEDVQAVRDQADYVIVSFHWSWEEVRDVHPEARTIAHRIIEAGADVIIGHHPHVPQGVEVYDGGFVLYSLGNFIFGHYREPWMDNILARITFTPEVTARAEVLPIAGIERELGQPYVLKGERANDLLTDMQARSAALGTLMEIKDGVGVIKPDAARLPPARSAVSAMLQAAANTTIVTAVLAAVFVALMIWTIARRIHGRRPLRRPR